MLNQFFSSKNKVKYYHFRKTSYFSKIFSDNVDDTDDDNDGILDIHDEDDDGDGIKDLEVKKKLFFTNVYCFNVQDSDWYGHDEI